MINEQQRKWREERIPRWRHGGHVTRFGPMGRGLSKIQVCLFVCPPGSTVSFVIGARMRPLESHRRTTVETGAIYSTRFTRIFAPFCSISQPIRNNTEIKSKCNSFGIFSYPFQCVLRRIRPGRCGIKCAGKVAPGTLGFRGLGLAGARIVGDRPSIFLFAPSFSCCGHLFRLFLLVHRRSDWLFIDNYELPRRVVALFVCGKSDIRQVLFVTSYRPIFLFFQNVVLHLCVPALVSL